MAETPVQPSAAPEMKGNLPEAPKEISDEKKAASPDQVKKAGKLKGFVGKAQTGLRWLAGQGGDTVKKGGAIDALSNSPYPVKAVEQPQGQLDKKAIAEVDKWKEKRGLSEPASVSVDTSTKVGDDTPMEGTSTGAGVSQAEARPFTGTTVEAPNPPTARPTEVNPVGSDDETAPAPDAVAPGNRPQQNEGPVSNVDAADTTSIPDRRVSVSPADVSLPGEAPVDVDEAAVQAEQVARQAQEAQQRRTEAYTAVTTEGANGEPAIDVTGKSNVDEVIDALVDQRGMDRYDPATRALAEDTVAEAGRREVEQQGQDDVEEVASVADGENAREQSDQPTAEEALTPEQQQIQELTQQLTDLKGENASLKTELMGVKEQLQKMYEQMANLVKAMETKDEKERITLLGMVKAFLKGVVVGAVVEIKDAAVEEASAAGAPPQRH